MMMSTKLNTIPDRLGPGSTTAAPVASSHQGGSGVKFITGGVLPAKKGLQVVKHDASFGTWNVRTLSADGKLMELEHELGKYIWSVVGIAEMRWCNSGETVSEEGHRVWWSGDSKKKIGGVGFIVHRECGNAVMECEPVSSRIIRIRLNATPRNLSVIQVYAPTSDYTEEDIEGFYNQLESTLKRIPKKDILVVMGDWNAKVGPDAHVDWPGTAGKFGLGTTNERGVRLLEFAKLHNLVVTNTKFKHKTSRRVTWVAPDGITKSQIDFILVERRSFSGINGHRTRSFPGADIGSDHNLVMTTFKLKLKRIKRPPNTRIKYDTNRLKDADVQEKFQIMIGGKFSPLMEITELQETTDRFTEGMNEVALEVLGKERRKKHAWMTDEILDKCDDRRKLKATKFRDEESCRKYKEASRLVKKEIKKAKKKFLQEKCEQIERAFERNDSTIAYSVVKELTNEKTAKVSVIEDANGNLLTEASKIQTRWTEYVQKLYSYPISTDANIIETLEQESSGVEDEEHGILMSEIEEAVRSLKDGKAVGFDNIPSELLKSGGTCTIEILHKICNLVWKSGDWPTQWTQSLIIPLAKKGDLKKCTNYRTISLISHPSKVLLKVISNRLKMRAEAILAEEQAGFRRGRSTVEQIANVRILGEKYRNHQMELHHNFIDFKKAFDRVWREALWLVMEKHKIGAGLVTVIESLYNNNSNAVLTSNSELEWFQTTVGVRQGCVLSPCLFNIFLEQIMMEALEDYSGTVKVAGQEINNLRFADDIALVAGSKEELANLTTRLDTVSRKYGMEISAEKSKIMVTSRNDGSVTAADAQIKVGDVELEEVKSFQYLGSTLNESVTSETEIKKRLAIATNQLAK
eukprot:gene9660-biopygen7980